MNYASCPTAVVNAPADVVWRLLTEPAGWEGFYDVRITNVVPPGPAVIGQRIYGETGRYLRFRLQFEFLKVDPAHHVLVFAVRLPFGISVREDMDCIPLNPTQCRVNYHCNFDLPDGWRGVLLRLILRRELDRGPVDSLLRLKRAAEGETSHTPTR